MKKESPYTGKHARAEERPWLVHPKKHRTPKIMKKLLILIGIIALLVIAYYLYLILNPSDKLAAQRI